MYKGRLSCTLVQIDNGKRNYMFPKEKFKFEPQQLSLKYQQGIVSQNRLLLRAKPVRVRVCLFDFGVYIIIFQNTDFKVRYLISFVPTIVAGEGQTLSKCF